MQPFVHNGKSYTNADAWRTAKATQPLKKAMANAADEDEVHAGEDGDEDGASVAEEHGPATEVHIEHAHEMGSHHVHSLHPDGHEHHSDHESAAKAHEHAAKLAGAQDGADDGDGDWEE